MTRALLVDDQADARARLRDLLLAHGWAVEEAGHGAEALLKARQAPPDLVLAELLLPGLDGFTLLRHWRDDPRLRRIPFAFHTAAASDPRDAALALELGADAVLPKATPAETLLARLRALLETARRDAPAHPPPARGEASASPPPPEALLARLAEKTAALEQAHRELAEREARLRAIFEAEPECVKLLAADGTLLDMNPAGLRMIEADSLDQVRGHRVASLVAEPYRAAFRELLRRVFQGGSGTLEFEVVGLQGTRRWLETHATPLRDADGRITALLALTRDITARKRTEAALQESEDRYRTLVENAADAIGIFQDNRLVYLNAAGAQQLGAASPAELLGRTSEELIHPEDHAAAMDRIRRRLAGESGIYPAEVRYRRLDGTTVTVEVNAAPITFRGKPAVQFMARDITARKQAEAQIARFNRTYAVLSDINQLIVREHDPQALLSGACRIAIEKGRLLLAWIGLVDAASGRLTVAAHAGATPDTLAVLEDCLRNPEQGCAFTAQALREGGHAVCQDIAHDERAASWRAAALARGYRAMVSLALTVGGRSIGTFNLYAGESGFFDAEELRLLDELAADLAYALENRERDRRRQEAEARARRLAAFPELNPNPVLEFSAAGQLNYQNPAAEMLAHQLGAGSPEQLLPPDTVAIVRECLATGQPRLRLETRHNRHTLSWSFYPITELGVVHVYAGDITERVLLEEQLRHAQKMEAIGRLAGGVAHDFNNILTAVLLQTEMLQAAPDLSATVRKGLEQIRASAERAANLTRQLLLFSRRQVLQPRDLDLNRVVGSLGEMIGRLIGEDVHLTLRLHPEPLPTRADAGMLDQVLMNLVVNARDAMPTGGRLVIETFAREVTPAEAATLPDAAPGPYVALRVSDTGCGISPEILPHIFEPFFTTKEPGKGTGLGLATVYSIVRQHDGFLQVTSEPGRGTTFEICLPARSPAGNRPASGPASAPPRGRAETILLVEDEPAVRALTRQTLERHGYRVLEASHGREALRLWEEHRAAVDLLLTDLVMPEGLGGLELARRLRASKPGLKVVYTSGYSAESGGLESEPRPDEGAFIQKPCPPERLLEIVRLSLDG
jgi:PAS domain S-box-containing protein